MQDQKILKFLLSEAEAGRSSVLIVIAQTKGSSAGKVGFKCAVTENKTMGTIGGGRAEYLMIKEAHEMLAASDEKPRLRKLAHNTESPEQKSGMICSGEQSCILLPVKPNILPQIKAVARSAQFQDRPGILHLSENGLEFQENSRLKKRHVYEELPETKSYRYSEQTGLPDTLYIIGGGHVGAAVTEIFRHLDFYIKVFDNRADLKIFKEISAAHEKHVIDYKKFAGCLKQDENKYIIIMTANHGSDQKILEQTVECGANYLGMLGSRSKIETIFSNLTKKGIPQSALDKVNTPAGLNIKSNTPYEIAVSIAAKIIDVKNRQS